MAEKDEDAQKTSRTENGKLALTGRLNEGDREGRRNTDKRRTGKIRSRQTEEKREWDGGEKNGDTKKKNREAEEKQYRKWETSKL